MAHQADRVHSPPGMLHFVTTLARSIAATAAVTSAASWRPATSWASTDMSSAFRSMFMVTSRWVNSRTPDVSRPGRSWAITTSHQRRTSSQGVQSRPVNMSPWFSRVWVPSSRVLDTLGGMLKIVWKAAGIGWRPFPAVRSMMRGKAAWQVEMLTAVTPDAQVP